MKQTAAYLFLGIGVITGALAAGSFALAWVMSMYEDPKWVWALFIGMGLFILCAATIAAGFTIHDPQHRMKSIPHPIAVGRSGAPEMTDPMPSPARVRRPVSEAYNPAKRTLSKEE